MPVQDHPRSRLRRGHRTPPPLTATAQGHSSKQDTTLIPLNMSNLIKKVNFKMKDFFLSKWKINWNWHDSIQECFSSDEKKITLKISLIYWCLFRNYFNEYLFKALWFSRNCKFLGNACRLHIMLCTSHICKHCFVILYLAFKT